MAGFANGTWNMTHTENLDGYMKAIGVNFVGRKLACSLTPSQEISVEGDNWNIKTITTFRTSELKFSLNQPFDEDTMDGRKAKTVVRLEDNKLIQDQKADPDCVIVRTFEGDTMTMTLTAKGETATRVYKKQS